MFKFEHRAQTLFFCLEHLLTSYPRELADPLLHFLCPQAPKPYAPYLEGQEVLTAAEAEKAPLVKRELPVNGGLSK